jgi:hypothetical protein
MLSYGTYNTLNNEIVVIEAFVGISLVNTKLLVLS